MGPDVTVLGAGIAGLACAIACAQRGRSVEVIEQAPRLTEVGAGLQIAPNGWRVLQALGVMPRSRESRAVHLIDGPTGRSVIRMPLGPSFHLMHRADLIEALAARATELGVVLHLGKRVTAIRDEGRSVIFAGGGECAARRLIGADGARGASRGFVAPDHRGTFTGQVAWRAIVPVQDWPDEAQVHMGPGRHLVCYPLRDGRSLNIVAVEERAAWVDAGWSHQDDPDHLRAAFAGFAPSVRDLLARVTAVNLWGLMDHGATPDWHRGICTLIGDAAHPTLPFLAQGANLGLEDAFTLAGSLDDGAGWQGSRRPRVTRALAAAAGNARNYHLSGLRRVVGQGALRTLGRVAPTAPLRAFGWLYDHDVTAAS
ncbi:FAD-dependent oxidoreductase [Jannaschia pohangensis]|uniref:Salicylate hydroxylase n=1 Tax=Jannaschia pohangensis TaxID=390807 RepID=A0A1I3IUU6_9RHOB|nr:FAD-dependent oxidoreductase [Jannaschia pohangensis]SFI51711.1 salicylate hydroxylase [Jannaschia pohangensis]